MQQSDSTWGFLIAEDDRMALELITEAINLKYPKVVTYTATNGRIGLEQFKKHQPTIIITDINMPEMDGLEMARQIVSLKKEVKIIAITAHGEKVIEDDAAKAGITVHCHLLKPLDYNQLFIAINDLLPASNLSSGTA